jgi:hypothetical protein
VCGAPLQTPTLPANIDPAKETVLYGEVRTSDGFPLQGAYVRLLDSTGEFTAEVVTSAEGSFRFFAAPGTWTLSTMHAKGAARAAISADGPGLFGAALVLS